MDFVSSGRKLFKAHQQSLDLFYTNNIDSLIFETYQKLILEKLYSTNNKRKGTIFFVSCGKTLSICNKISNMLNSLDVSSRSLNANECLHGDIGSIDCSNPHNVVIFVSMTGDTSEVVRCFETLEKKIEHSCLEKSEMPLFLSLTGRSTSLLHRKIKNEGGVSIPLNFDGILSDDEIFLKAPTLSLQLLYLFMDCLFVDIVEQTASKEELSTQFFLNHPGGGLGKQQ
ncbi:hypothetical protein QEN19_000142 [Hanseniaspora menglaensis]